MHRESVCSIDLGTSHIKAGIVDAEGHIRVFKERPAPACLPSSGFAFDVESYLATLWQVLRAATSRAMQDGLVIRGVTVTNQRATILPVGGDGRAIGAAVSWQDTRGGEAMERFIAGFGRERFIRITGLSPSAIWSLAKLLWLRDESPDQYRAAERFVLLHDYALARLGADAFYTDCSNASLTGFLQLATCAWSTEILAAVDMSTDRLPIIRPAGAIAGTVSHEAAEATGLPAGALLLVGGGDQQCGTLGIGAIDPGMAGLVLGTAGVINCPTRQPVFDDAGHLFCTAHVIPDRWIIEGIHNFFGSSARWLSDLLQIDTPEAVDALAAKVAPGAGGLCFYSFLAGIGSPDFDADARGAFLGIDRGTGRAEFARAVLDGIAFELRRILDSIHSHLPLQQIIVAGGGAMRPYRIQMLADYLGQPLLVNPTTEATLLGAALLAWIGLGHFTSFEEAVHCCAGTSAEQIMPQLPAAQRERLYAHYCQGIRLVRQFHQTPAGVDS